jgi:peptidoglycan/LPS O-acetylase OafA/YrhL
MIKIRYFPEIDGLRAIAVLSVIIYHANISINELRIFSGGFLGVDIFFVISGYLITSILLKNYKDKNKISIKSFYERRIRRIFPALLTVIFTSFIFSWFLLPPLEKIDFYYSSIASIGFVSNFYFWHSGEIYGAIGSQFKPLLHTWSLGVEEQFYIFFPVYLYLAFKFFKKFLLISLYIFLSLSFLFANWGSLIYPDFNFFFSGTRVWEILIGVILAFPNQSKFKPQSIIKKKLYDFLPYLGFVMIIFPMLTFLDPQKVNYLTLIPLVGTVIIIGLKEEKNLVNKLLSSKFFVFFGLISYSLYLWHFPIFVFSKYIFNETTIILQVSLIFLTTIISYISFKLIEQPFRNKSVINTKILSIICVNSIIIILFLSIFYLNNQNALIGKYQKIFSEKAQNIENTYRSKIAKNLKRNTDDLMSSNSNKRDIKKVLIIGDSHAKRWDLAFANQFPNTFFESLDYNECNLVKIEGEFFQKTQLKDLLKFEQNNKCQKISKFFNDHKKLKNYKSIVLASLKPFSSEFNLFRFELVKKLQEINPGIEVIILGNYYILPKSKRSCAFVSQKNDFQLLSCLLNTNYPDKNHDFTKERYFDEFKFFTFVDVTKICNTNKNNCPYQIKGVPFLFHDWNHNSFYFVNFLLKEMINKKILKAKF